MSLTHTLDVAASVKKANPTRNRVGFCAIHVKLISFRTLSITYFKKRSNFRYFHSFKEYTRINMRSYMFMRMFMLIFIRIVYLVNKVPNKI
ncbi:hypothetical protein DRJ90_15460 [Enterococcus faecalis]|nr:hypothetical protein DRJ90_15460 [Enterococcus faecalis]